MKRTIGLAICVLLLASSEGRTQAPSPIRGFTAANSARQRQAEEKFRAVPKPENLREYMRATSDEPHHAGGPGSRKVAEYVLSQFRSWGLSASIEPFEALMPFPTERVVELVAPERYVLKLQEATIAQDPDRCPQGDRWPRSGRR